MAGCVPTAQPVRVAPPPGLRETSLSAQTEWRSPPALRPLREGVAQLGATSLYYQDTGGTGPAVVLCHPWTGSYAIWGYQQQSLADAGYRVVTYSMRGHFGSGPIDARDPGTVTGDLAMLLDHLDVEPAHLVGSAGGVLPAVEYALTRPERTLSLTAASGHMGISDSWFAAQNRRMFPPGVYAVSHAFSELGPSYRAAFPEGVAAWEALDEQAWQGGDIRQDTIAPISFTRLQDLRVPLMLMTGGADLIMPPSRLREVARRVAHRELVIVAEGGHSLYWEQPIAFNAALTGFFADVDADRRDTTA